jgi:proteasome accessory factor B
MAASVRDRTWHHSQKICEEPGGSIVLSFEAGGRMEIIAWLLSFGAHAEVLAPAELREELRHQVRQMMSRYGES